LPALAPLGLAPISAAAQKTSAKRATKHAVIGLGVHENNPGGGRASTTRISVPCGGDDGGNTISIRAALLAVLLVLSRLGCTLFMHMQLLLLLAALVMCLFMVVFLIFWSVTLADIRSCRALLTFVFQSCGLR